jgi:hypothetical protein
VAAGNGGFPARNAVEELIDKPAVPFSGPPRKTIRLLLRNSYFLLLISLVFLERFRNGGFQSLDARPM